MNHSHEMEGGTPWIMAAGVAQKTSSQLVPLPDGTLTRARKHTQRTGRRINGGTGWLVMLIGFGSCDVFFSSGMFPSNFKVYQESRREDETNKITFVLRKEQKFFRGLRLSVLGRLKCRSRARTTT